MPKTQKTKLEEVCKEIISAVPEILKLKRSINLEDVLFILNKIQYRICGNWVENTVLIFCEEEGSFAQEMWQLGKPLHQQPPKTISFLHDLFFNKKR